MTRDIFGGNLAKRALLAPLVVVALLAGCADRDSSVTDTSGVTDTSAAPGNRCDSNTGSDDLVLHVPSPDWSEQVIYFLMTDRFNDGIPENNDQGAGEYAPDKEAYWSGGDIQGIIDKLDYIQSLGATSVWITPPVANQWWSDNDQFSGYHGYWASHFKKVDQHYGTLDDYKRLSHELHCRGMYLVQDIVANHTGVFFGYDGEYDPADTAKNFVLFEKDDPLQSTPEMYPYNMVDRHDPEHANAGIYNWTPGIVDFSELDQQYTYQLGSLADLNTKNPLVLRTLKDAYSYWIEEVGVDAFRVDTVKYVEHEFWHHFFNDEDGIFPTAKAAGKAHFLAFGEVFESSAAFDNSGEHKVASYLGTAENPELNSNIGFPLYFEIDRVLAGGKPTSQLAYRLQQHMEVYPDPYVIPNFVDNHDTKRFLSAGSVAAIKQALSVIFTIPGIPILYQGTEQGLKDTRQAMFAGGYLGSEGGFDQQSGLYRFIRELTELRSGNKVLTHGGMEQLAAEDSGQGVLAYKREYQGDSVLVIMNSADHGILVNGLATGYDAGQVLTPLFGEGDGNELITGPAGRLTLELPGRAILIVQPAGTPSDPTPDTTPQLSFTFDRSLDDQVFAGDFAISGSVGRANTSLKLIIDGNLDRATVFTSDDQGRWQTSIAVRNLGEAQHSLEIYASEFKAVSARQTYRTRIVEPTHTGAVTDATGDAHGPTGKYIRPQHDMSYEQHDIQSVSYRAAGGNLELTLTMKQITDVWGGGNGFDNVSVSTFINLPNRSGISALPLLDARMTGELDWDVAHVAYGWGNYMYSSEGSDTHEQGNKLGLSPTVRVDKELRTISFVYEGERFGIEDWGGSQFYITTWDVTGEGTYREVTPEGSGWYFGGAEHGSPRVMDDVLVTIDNE